MALCLFPCSQQYISTAVLPIYAALACKSAHPILVPAHIRLIMGADIFC